jgi:hypothetical protein
MKEAQVKGSELILRTQMAYTALSRAATQGQRAFKKASAWKIEDMNNATRKRLEIAMLYGRVWCRHRGLARVRRSSRSPRPRGLAESGRVAENAVIDVYQSNLSHRSVRPRLVIARVDSDNQALTVTGTTTGIASTDVIYFRGANSSGTFNEMAGLQKIITNSTTLFNIDASVYSLWKGNTVCVRGSARPSARSRTRSRKCREQGPDGEGAGPGLARRPGRR